MFSANYPARDGMSSPAVQVHTPLASASREAAAYHRKRSIDDANHRNYFPARKLCPGCPILPSRETKPRKAVPKAVSDQLLSPRAHHRAPPQAIHIGEKTAYSSACGWHNCTNKQAATVWRTRKSKLIRHSTITVTAQPYSTGFCDLWLSDVYNCYPACCHTILASPSRHGPEHGGGVPIRPARNNRPPSRAAGAENLLDETDHMVDVTAGTSPVNEPLTHVQNSAFASFLFPESGSLPDFRESIGRTADRLQVM